MLLQTTEDRWLNMSNSPVSSCLDLHKSPGLLFVRSPWADMAAGIVATTVVAKIRRVNRPFQTDERGQLPLSDGGR